jgi:hypothetical protein
MIYELLVGRPPFVGNPGQVMRQHYMTPPSAPSTLNPSVSAAIDAVLLRALSKQPDERFATVTAFARAFQEAVQSDGELHATLALSRAEAEGGTTRILTLPGGRQVSVSVPAGVDAGTTLRLEGQGMPYYEGGPAGPLVLTIAIPAEVSPLPLPQDSTDLTVAATMPNAEVPSSEDLRVPPVRLKAPSDLEPPVLASNSSESAPTVFASNAPLLAPQPPSPQRRGKRIGLIVGLALLILLLIGGGVFAWLEYTAGRSAATAAAVATTTALAHATATASAQARSQPFPAKGTATLLSNTTTKVVQDGSNKISSITGQWVIYGGIMGSFTADETSILHPDNTTTSSGMITCSCTVAGKSGTLMWSFTYTGAADGSYRGQFFDFHGTGDLAKLHGQGTFQGQGSHATYTTELYFGA